MSTSTTSRPSRRQLLRTAGGLALGLPLLTACTGGGQSSQNAGADAVGMSAFVGENDTDWAGMSAAAVFVVLQRQFVESLAGAVKQ